MFTQKQLENILFFDIETVSSSPDFDALSDRYQKLWEQKAAYFINRAEAPLTAAEVFEDRAAIFAEFGKVVCISCGYLRFQEDGKPKIKLKSFFHDQEKQLLLQFKEMLDAYTAQPQRTLCAHNGKEFDIPYLCRRYLINGLPMPAFLAELQGKKPWEVQVLDTMQLWKFGDYKSYTSLDLLTAALQVPSPKDDMDGSQVGKVYWEDRDLERIARYCEQDVVATAQVMLRYSGLPLVEVG